jgi:hypothetical protein
MLRGLWAPVRLKAGLVTTHHVHKVGGARTPRLFHGIACTTAFTEMVLSRSEAGLKKWESVLKTPLATVHQVKL